ncbi:probable LRR receptor-like serine/threonine-protein kinase At4g36180 [Durio zibethinus]|uniref:Probable LRR receptor-like serine/threonine-protein kinase At4g36180 n=1 Tax=Durio zibethinus TaxID=66656 RepID=A0A6P5Z5Z4_DURZI|nr:probable LRR receptor-like serine/threonine-protein kinase At4g36180 [Durio zibethinus]
MLLCPEYVVDSSSWFRVIECGQLVQMMECCFFTNIGAVTKENFQIQKPDIYIQEFFYLNMILKWIRYSRKWSYQCSLDASHMLTNTAGQNQTPKLLTYCTLVLVEKPSTLKYKPISSITILVRGLNLLGLATSIVGRNDTDQQTLPEHYRVTKLELQLQKLAGSVSPYIGNLSFLRVLNIAGNCFNNEIPQEIGRLRRLEILEFSNNSINGELPSNLSGSSTLTIVHMLGNQLTGEIPSLLCNALISHRDILNTISQVGCESPQMILDTSSVGCVYYPNVTKYSNNIVVTYERHPRLDIRSGLLKSLPVGKCPS